jgi:hypothetical protein
MKAIEDRILDFAADHLGEKKQEVSLSSKA